MQSSDTFRDLFYQDQTDSNGNASSASPSSAESNGNCVGTDQETTVKKSFSDRVRDISVETQASSRRKKCTGEAGAVAPASDAQSLDLSTASRWLLSLMGSTTSASSSTAFSSPDLDVQAQTPPCAQLNAMAVPTQEGRASASPLVLLDPMANPLIGVSNAINGATQGSVDVAPFAELSLTPVSTPATPVPATAPQMDSSLIPSAEDRFSIRFEPTTDTGSQSQGVTAMEAVPGIRLSTPKHGGESSLDQPASGQQEVPAALKKEAAPDSGQGEDSSALAGRGRDQTDAVSPIAIPPAESQKARNSAEAPAPASPVMEPTPPAPVKPFSSSVGTIELQIRVADEQQVGLRFVERQGHVEIQLKSGDAQTAQALSDNLAGLKTSLNENGWDVESRIQSRLSPAGPGPQAEASADRRSFPLAQLESSTLPTRASFGSASTTGDQQTREFAEQIGVLRTPRSEQLSTTQTNHQSGSDSSSAQDQSRSDRDGASGGNGQHSRNGNAERDAERQGRRSVRDSEAWLDSMESNLTRSSSPQVTTGEIK
jgi:hypothetical protein